MKYYKVILAILSASLTFGISNASADRIKDIAQLAAARPNQLLGYGIVVGLQGTGDGKDLPFTVQALRDTLKRLGSSLDGPLSSYDINPATITDVKIENVAAVMITAELPAFAAVCC